MRCLALAQDIQENGGTVTFISRALSHLEEVIAQVGINIIKLTPEKSLDFEKTQYGEWLGVSWESDAIQTVEILKKENPEWLIVDHYALDHRWEKSISSYVKNLFVVDDLANRRHECDVLLDAGFHPHFESRYTHLVSSKCFKILGPANIILGPSFRKAPKRKRKKVRRILLNFGGVDFTNETHKALRALKKIDTPIFEIDVVVGRLNKKSKEIEDFCKDFLKVNVHYNVSDLAPLMVHADLALGACGTTTWERCFLGLPSLVNIACENQRECAVALMEKRVLYLVGEGEILNEEDWLKAIQYGLTEDFITETSCKALELFTQCFSWKKFLKDWEKRTCKNF